MLPLFLYSQVLLSVFPVVDDNNEKMIGIITDKDILKAVARKTSITTAYIPKNLTLKSKDETKKVILHS